MGLDWNPMARPLAGYEAEFARLVATDLDAMATDDYERLRARFDEISEPPFLTVGAPRIGYDAKADEWLCERLRDGDRVADFDEVRASMIGYCVLDLLPPSDGLPVYGSSGYEGVDRYT